MRAAILDQDGTLVDLFDLHYQSFRAIIGGSYGLEFDRKTLEELYGRSGEEIFTAFFGKMGISAPDIPQMADRRRAWVMEHLDRCSTLPGVKRLLDGLKAAGIPMAVGSSNPPQIGSAILAACGMESYFSFLSFRDADVAGKPAPDIFLRAASGLGIPPEVCVVFEDSIYGVQAAKAAGMKVVAVATGTHTWEQLEREGPDILVNTLEGLPLADVLTL